MSRTGRTRTAPAYGASPSSLTVAVASCAQYEHGYFTAYRRHRRGRTRTWSCTSATTCTSSARDDYVAYPHNVRDLRRRRRPSRSPTTAAGTRSTRPTRTCRSRTRAAPWSRGLRRPRGRRQLGGDACRSSAQPHFRHRRAAAFRAYYENMPLRRTSLPRGPGMQIYRRVRWGDLATLHLMDTRQYRDDQACGDHRQAGCAARLDPRRSMHRRPPGALAARRARAPRTRAGTCSASRSSSRSATPRGRRGLQVGMDAWDGYAASRQPASSTAFAERRVAQPRRAHRRRAPALRERPPPATPTALSLRPIGVELVTSSMTSGGDGKDTSREAADELARTTRTSSSRTAAAAIS